MTLSKDHLSTQTVAPKDQGLSQQFYSSTLGLDQPTRFLSAPTITDTSLVGGFYVNSVQMEDYTQKPSLMPTQNFALMPIYAELNELDDSYSNFKSTLGLMNKFSAAPMGLIATGLGSRSYISVFNNFRSDFDDFT